MIVAFFCRSPIGFFKSIPARTHGEPKVRYSIQVEPGKPGAEVSKKKTISQRKNLPIECAQGDQPLRCPNRVF